MEVGGLPIAVPKGCGGGSFGTAALLQSWALLKDLRGSTHEQNQDRRHFPDYLKIKTVGLDF